jgi:hypothetical protein
MMSIDQAETRRCDLSQEDRSRQVGRLDSSVIEPSAAPVIWDLRQLDDFGREAFRLGRDVDLSPEFEVSLELD